MLAGRQPSSGAVLVTALLVLSACQQKKSGPSRASSQSSSQATGAPASPAPDFVIGAKELALEYAADPQATDKKYAGKVVQISGEIESVTIGAQNAYVSVSGGPFTENTKLFTQRAEDPMIANRWVKLSCTTTPTSYVTFLHRTFKDKPAPSIGKLVTTFKGRYDKSLADGKPGAWIEFAACEIVEPEKPSSP